MVEINPFSALTSFGQANSDQRTIADNFDTFLSLLTTQLQNQNPLDPLDTNQFTQQLVQFTEVEQSVKMNSNLETLAKLSAANTITNAVGYIGTQVTASGADATLSAGAASWTYQISGDSPAATFTVFDSEGRQVYAQTGPAPGGSGVFLWDGRTTEGGIAPDGVYTLAIRAEDGNGGVLDASSEMSGVVDGVDMSGSDPVLLVGDRRIRLDEITSIKMAEGA